MRLTNKQIATISNATEKYFGVNSHVWLFGSRVDDEKKGGDIDLYIEPESNIVDDIVIAKLNYLSELHQQMGEQKIDVVLRRNNFTKELPIYKFALETGVQIR